MKCNFLISKQNDYERKNNIKPKFIRQTPESTIRTKRVAQDSIHKKNIVKKGINTQILK